MAEVILIFFIVIYAAFVIRKKCRDRKSGRMCGCGCLGCINAKKCGNSEKNVLH